MTYEFKSKTKNPRFEGVFDVSPQEVLENAAQLNLIDVREVSEYNAELGHVAGTKLVVLSTLPQNLDSLKKDKPTVFICRSGGRSAQASAFAQQQGFEVYNMAGGMILWNQLQLPIEK